MSTGSGVNASPVSGRLFSDRSSPQKLGVDIHARSKIGKEKWCMALAVDDNPLL
jgi:hypothetical protein